MKMAHPSVRRNHGTGKSGESALAEAMADGPADKNVCGTCRRHSAGNKLRAINPINCGRKFINSHGGPGKG